MAERLRLTRTVGVAGWQAWQIEGNSPVLAALGVCLLRPARVVALRGMWRLMRAWRSGLDAIEPRAVRLALAMHREVAVSGVRVQVDLAHGAAHGAARGRRAPRAFRLALHRERVRAASLPAAPSGCTWTVLRLAAGHERAFAALTAALVATPKGTRLTLEFAARRAGAPDTLRTDFPLRAEGRLGAADGWFPLIRESRLDLATLYGSEAL